MDQNNASKSPDPGFGPLLALGLSTLLLTASYLASLNTERRIRAPKPRQYTHISHNLSSFKPKSPPHLPNVLIYNRPPKTGSTTIKKVLQRLSAINRFKYVHSKDYSHRHINKTEQEVTSWLL